MNIYVGNLHRDLDDKGLRLAFEAIGSVESANVIKDKVTGKSRGFGFVEMEDEKQARAAIETMNGKDLMGRAINVNEARPRGRDYETGSRGRRGGGRRW